MARISLKREIGNILNGAILYQSINDPWGNKVLTYRAYGKGRSNYTIGVQRSETLAEVITAMQKKAESMFRKKSERMDGGIERQKRMAVLMTKRHLLQDIADIRYQHLTNGYPFEKAMRLVYDYKKELPEEVAKISRHTGGGEWINVYSIKGIEMYWAVELLPLLPPAYLKGIDLGC